MKYSSVKGITHDRTRDVVQITKEYTGNEPIVGPETIIINQAAFVNHGLLSRGDLFINSGAIVIGNVKAGRRLEIVCSPSSLAAPTLIMGDLTADQVHVRFPASQGEGNMFPVLLFGNVFAHEFTGEGDFFVRGNLFARDAFISSRHGFVAGRTKFGDANHPAKVIIENFGTFEIYAHGDVTFGKNNSVLVPLVSVNKTAHSPAAVHMESSMLRVISAPCLNCSQSDDLLSCRMMEACDRYSVLTRDDLFHQDGSAFISWYWRCLPETILHHYIVNQFFITTLRRDDRYQDFEKYNNKAFFNDLYHEQVIKRLFAIDTSISSIKRWFEARGINTESLFSANVNDKADFKQNIGVPFIM